MSKKAKTEWAATESLVAEMDDWLEESERLLHISELVTMIATLKVQLVSERERYEAEHATRIELEKRVAKRGARIHELDEIRQFEGETERLLVSALDEIVAHSAVGSAAYWWANTTLNTYADRRGPRS